MSNTIKSYKIEIFGEHYTLLSDESEQHVRQSAHLVDTYMKEIANKLTSKNVGQIAVLAAVRLASMVLYKEAELEQQQHHEKELIALIENELQKENEAPVL